MFKINFVKREEVKLDALPEHIPPVFDKQNIFSERSMPTIEYHTVGDFLIAFVHHPQTEGTIAHTKTYQWMNKGYWKYVRTSIINK